MTTMMSTVIVRVKSRRDQVTHRERCIVDVGLDFGDTNSLDRTPMKRRVAVKHSANTPAGIRDDLMEDFIENRSVDSVVVHPEIDSLLVAITPDIKPTKDMLSKE